MGKIKQEQELILGIDDAGRGPIIGPMAMAGCLITPEIEEQFKKLGVKDSKLLTPKKREFLGKQIKEKALSFNIRLTHPYDIDNRLKTNLNLNKIEAIEAAEIINYLTRTIKEPVRVVIDCPSPNKESWRRYLLTKIKFNENLTIACEHKADKNHIAVGAASILAKSMREREVEKIKKKIRKDFGSGYPSDPLTKKFLEEYSHEHEKDGIFRETWATWQNHKREKEQKKIFEF